MKISKCCVNGWVLVTKSNAAIIPDNGGGAIGASAVDGGVIGGGAVSACAVGADDAIDAVVGVIGTTSDGDAGIVSTYY